MKIIIAGSRTFDDFALLEKTMDAITRKLKKVIILSGTAAGADTLGENWAYSRWHTVMRYHPDWDKDGKVAGVIRNREMVKNADGLVAFWDGSSPGTKDVIAKAKKKGIRVKVVLFKPKVVAKTRRKK
jgi:hypothetical protein